MDFLKNTRCCELDNGFRIYFFHRPGPAVEMQIYVATGSVHEGKFLGCGLSHFLEHMLFQGCRDFPGHAVSDTVTALGGDLNATTWCDRTCYRMTLPREHWKLGVDMLSSMVQFPELPEERFLAERDVILRECERGMDNVGTRMYEKMIKLMFQRHPLRHPIIGYKDMIATVTRDMAMEYHEARYAPNRSFAVVVGNCHWEEVREYFSSKVGNWKRKNLAEMTFPAESVPIGGRGEEFVFNDAVSRVMWGVQLPEYGSPVLPAADILFGMVGTGESSFINTEMVINSSLALNGRSFCFALADQAMAGVSLEVENRKLPAAEKALNKLLERCADGSFSAARMERERQQQCADRMRTLRSILSIAGEIAEGVIHAGDPGAGDRFIEQLQKVDYEQLRQVAQNILGSDRWVKVRQLPRAKTVCSKECDSKPQIETAPAAGGGTMLWAPDNSLPLSCFSLIVPGGTIYEAPGKGGISQLCAAMMCAKIPGMSEEAVLNKLDELCIDIDISSGSNSLMLDFSVPEKKFRKAVEFIGKLLANAEFTPTVLERERNYLLSRLQVRRENPVKAALDCAQRTMYGSHPYANGTAGELAALKSITLEEVKEFYRKLWNPEQTAFAFGGACSRKDAETLAENLSKKLPWVTEESRMLPERPVFPAEMYRKELTLPREQTVVLRTLPGVALDDMDAVTALDILANMENGLGSRLFNEVREKNALSYSVGMTYSCGFHPGTVTFYAMTKPGAQDKVLELFEQEISRLARGGFSDEEFESARRGAAFDSEVTLSKPESLLRTALLDHYYGLDAARVLEKSENIRNFSREIFSRKINELLNTPPGCSVVLLPEK